MLSSAGDWITATHCCMGVTDHLQSVQNATSQLIIRFGGGRIPQLHWLPYADKFSLRLLISHSYIFLSLTRQALSNLSDDYRLLSSLNHRQLRSADVNMCYVPPKHNRFGKGNLNLFGAFNPKTTKVFRTKPQEIRRDVVCANCSIAFTSAVLRSACFADCSIQHLSILTATYRPRMDGPCPLR